MYENKRIQCSLSDWQLQIWLTTVPFTTALPTQPLNRLKLQKQVQEMPLKGKGRGDSKTVINDELLGRNLILFV